MQHHPQEPHAPDTSALPSSLNPPASASRSEARLNAYLDTICALIPSDVPIPVLAQMRREMADHLDAAITALAELGYAPEEALTHAFAQFGEPRVVAKHWREEWEETLPQTNARAFWPSLKLALKTWTAAHVAVMVVWLYLFVHPYGPASAHPHAESVLVFLDRMARMTAFFGPQIGVGHFSVGAHVAILSSALFSATCSLYPLSRSQYWFSSH